MKGTIVLLCVFLPTITSAQEHAALRASLPAADKKHRNLQLAEALDKAMELEPAAPVPPASKWFKAFGRSCDYSGLLGALTMAGFPNPSSTLLQLGIDAQYVESACLKAYKLSGFLPFREVFDENEYMYVKEYFDGNEEPNEERETYINDFHVRKEVLQDREIGLRINRIFQTWAPYRGIEFPEEQVVNFRDCKLNSVMCCYAQDRQAGDDNGNCNTPYDFNCVDKDPADNTDICLVDMERAPESNRVDGGFGVFEGNVEGSTHCHGFAWAENPFDFSHVYRGNNLFYVAPYDHFYTRGYVRNIDGAPMCGCLEQMPVVSRSDCTQMDVRQLVKWYYNPGTPTTPDCLTAKIVHLRIDYRPCDGVNGPNEDDLLEHIRLLAQQGKVPSTNLPAVQNTLVEDCSEPIAEFLQSKNIKKKLVQKEPDLVAKTDAAALESLRQRNPLERITFRSPLVSRSNLAVFAGAGEGDVEFGATSEAVHPAATWVFKEVPYCSGGQSKVCFVVENEASGRLLYATVGENGEEGVGAAAPSDTYGEDQVWYLESDGDGSSWLVNSFSRRALYAEEINGVIAVGADSRQENFADYKWVLESVPELLGGDATDTEGGEDVASPPLETAPETPSLREASPGLGEASPSRSFGRGEVIP